MTPIGPEPVPSAQTGASDVEKRAIRAVVFAVLLGLAAWFGLKRASTIGLARLEAYDRVRAACAARYAAATSAEDSTKADESPISEVLDKGVEGAPRRCADLKSPGAMSRR